MEVTSKIVFTSFWNGVYSKMKEFAPCGSKFFPFKVDPFSEETRTGKQTESHKKNVSLLKYGRKSTICIKTP